MMGSKVTVLIPFYNPGYHILEALDSVYAQTYKDWKLILIDDGSTENVLSVIEDYLKDPRVRFVRHPQNKGQSKSLNTGLKLVDTPFLIQLDADDWFTPNTLEVLLKETESNPETTAVFSGNINIVYDDSGLESFQHVKRQRHNEKRIMRQIQPDQMDVRKGRAFEDQYDFLMANCSVWPRFYRTSALQSIGGWPVDDPYEGRYAEDLRILFRLIEQYRFHWVDAVLMNHRRHNQNQTNDLKIYQDIMEWNVRDTLKRWGDEFEPVFHINEEGWIAVTELRPK